MSKNIYLTVDTECHNIDCLNQYVYGHTSRGNFGLERILQLGKEMNVPINVFVDIPELHKYGENYIRKIINLVKDYNQPIFLHVHPDYIADANRKHLWEYSKEEQKRILLQSIQDYIKYVKTDGRLVFRAGAWGVNSDTYEVLSEIKHELGINEIIDLSYVYKSRWRCHLSYKELGAANACRKYKDTIIFPNTTYIGLDYLGKQYAFEFSVANPSFSEIKNIIDQNTLNNITYTMHSWDFIKKWFFLPSRFIGGNNRQIGIAKKSIQYARKKGYEFADLRSFKITNEPDECLNICKGIKGKLLCLWYNYLRFANIGRSFKKYAILYFFPFILFVFLIMFCLIV